MSAATHYQEWYPDFGEYFLTVLQTQCTQAYNDYITKNVTIPCNEPVLATCLNSGVINCILSNTSPSVNANLAATSVLLGLLPTILLQTGATLPQYTYLIARRPFLGILLAMSTAPVSTVQTQDYAQPNRILASSSSALHPPRSSLQRYLVLALEYALAMGAVSNLMVMLWQFSTRSTLAWAQRFTNGGTVWITLALLLHILSCIALRLRIRVARISSRSERNGLSNLVSYIRQEFTLSCEPLDHTTIRFVAKPESWLFVVLTWFVSTTAVFHLIFGTVLLAGLLFISVKDAIIIGIRFLASTIVARLILMYELNGMSKHVELDERYVPRAMTMPRVQIETEGNDKRIHQDRVSDVELDEMSQSDHLVDRR